MSTAHDSRTIIDVSDDTGVPRWRVVATQVLSGLVGLLVGVMFFSLPLLVLAWLGPDEEVIHTIHGVGWGITGGLIVAVGLLSQVWRPAQRIAGLQMALIGILSLGISVALGMSSPQEVAPFVIIGAILCLIHPARDELLRAGPVNRSQAVLPAVAAVPAVWYALDQASRSRAAGVGDPHVATDNHYETMAAMAIALVLVGLLGAARTRGWRLPTVIAGLGTTYFGLASIASGTAGSIGDVGGAIVAVLGVAYLVVALRPATVHPAR